MPSAFDDDPSLGKVRAALWRELGQGGTALPQLTADLQDDAAARLRTRVRALLTEIRRYVTDVAAEAPRPARTSRAARGALLAPRRNDRPITSPADQSEVVVRPSRHGVPNRRLIIKIH